MQFNTVLNIVSCSHSFHLYESNKAISVTVSVFGVPWSLMKCVCYALTSGNPNNFCHSMAWGTKWKSNLNYNNMRITTSSTVINVNISSVVYSLLVANHDCDYDLCSRHRQKRTTYEQTFSHCEYKLSFTYKHSRWVLPWCSTGEPLKSNVTSLAPDFNLEWYLEMRCRMSS